MLWPTPQKYKLKANLEDGFELKYFSQTLLLTKTNLHQIEFEHFLSGNRVYISKTHKDSTQWALKNPYHRFRDF